MQGPRLNRYVCPKCHNSVVTVDLVPDGVTPMLIRCTAEECDGMMTSSFYRGVAPGEKATYEWYRPGKAEFARLDKATADHVANGGLLIRLVGDKPGEDEPMDLASLPKRTPWWKDEAPLEVRASRQLLDDIASSLTPPAAPLVFKSFELKAPQAFPREGEAPAAAPRRPLFKRRPGRKHKFG